MRMDGSSLISITHYHQEPSRQPEAQPLGRGREVFELVTAGRGWIEEGGERVEVGRGALLWQVEGERTISLSDPEDPYSCLALRVKDVVPCGRAAPRVTYWRDLPTIANFAREAVRSFVDERIDRGTLARYVYGRLSFQAISYAAGSDTRGVSDPLRRVNELIESRYGENLRMKDLALAAGWSEAHLFERFKQEIGQTPRAALIDRRINMAKELLLGSGLSVKEIAARCGFNRSSAFCASFKKSEGETPKRYREARLYGRGFD